MEQLSVLLLTTYIIILKRIGGRSVNADITFPSLRLKSLPCDGCFERFYFSAKRVGEKSHVFNGADGLVAGGHRFAWINLEWGEN